MPGIVDITYKQRPKNFFKLPTAKHEDKVTLTKETRMPVEYITEGRAGHINKKTVQSFPSPLKHVD